jgi:hypothetical protein
VEYEVWPTPSRLKTWIDPDGNAWHRAGDSPLKLAVARRLLNDQAVRVVLFYMDPMPVVTADERAALWSRMDPVMRGRPVANPYSDFVAFRYRDDAGNKMLAVEERC